MSVDKLFYQTIHPRQCTLGEISDVHSVFIHNNDCDIIASFHMFENYCRNYDHSYHYDTETTVKWYDLALCMLRKVKSEEICAHFLKSL